MQNQNFIYIDVIRKTTACWNGFRAVSVNPQRLLSLGIAVFLPLLLRGRCAKKNLKRMVSVCQRSFQENLSSLFVCKSCREEGEHMLDRIS